jgi:putative RecB family exonuclease
LGCFENCPRQFRYRYIDKLPAPSESIEAFVGKRVHDILERLHRFLDKGRIPPLDAVLQRFRTLWEERFDGRRIRIVREGTTAEGYRAEGERCLRNHYRRHYPFDREETVAIEERVIFSLDDADAYRMQGVIDRLVRAADGCLEIHDYKTARRLPRQSALDQDRQLALYEMGVRTRYPESGEVRLVWHYLMHDQVRSSSRTAQQLAELRGRTMELIDRIRSEREFEPRPGPLCGWCEYNGICPAGAVRAQAKEPRPAPPAAVPPEPPPPPGQLPLL